MPMKKFTDERPKDLGQYYPLLFTVIFIVFLFQYSFSSLEALFYDLRVKLDIGNTFDDNIVLVTLDEESDQFLGEKYPYTFATHNRFIEKLAVDSPAVVNFLIDFYKNKNYAFDESVNDFYENVNVYKNKGGHFKFGSLSEELNKYDMPIFYNLGVLPANLSTDSGDFARDGVLRKAVLNIHGEDSIHLWAANTYRKIQGREPIEARGHFGSYYSRETDAIYSLFRFATNPQDKISKIKTIPYHKIVVGNYPKGFFKNKIVLVGPQYISNPHDFILTPFNRESLNSSKLNVHAQIIQALVKEKLLFKIPRTITDIWTFFIAIFLSIIISKVNPGRGLAITFSTLFIVILIAYLSFVTLGLWIYLSHLILAIFTVFYIWVPFRAIEEYKRRFAIQEESKLLKKVDSLKHNFISLMSHDLKTPVAKINGIAENLLKQFHLNNEQKDYALSIISATKELNSFITKILELAKIESENFLLQRGQKDINKILKEVATSLKFEATRKSINIDLSLAPLYPITIDANLMRQVFSNIVGNAIKYSNENSHINIKSWDDEEYVYINVKDEGVGIAEKDVKHIFDKFFRVKSDLNQINKGTGLGLYLVKYFIELHDGKISVESIINQGSSFLIQLKNA